MSGHGMALAATTCSDRASSQPHSGSRRTYRPCPSPEWFCCGAAEAARPAQGRGALEVAAAEGSGRTFHAASRQGLCSLTADNHHCFPVETQELRDTGRKDERKNMTPHTAEQDASSLAVPAHAACPSSHPHSCPLLHSSSATSDVRLQTNSCPHCKDSSAKQLLNIQKQQRRRLHMPSCGHKTTAAGHEPRPLSQG